MRYRLRSAVNRLQERWSPLKKAFDHQAGEGIIKADAATTPKPKETAFHRAAQRTRDAVTEASQRTRRAARQHASAQMDATRQWTLQSMESAKQFSVESLGSVKQSARTLVERAGQSILKAPLRRASQVAHDALADSTAAVKEYASTKMKSAKLLSLRWLWWWSLAAVGVYGLAVSIPREVRVAIENRRNEEGEK